LLLQGIAADRISTLRRFWKATCSGCWARQGALVWFRRAHDLNALGAYREWLPSKKRRSVEIRISGDALKQQRLRLCQSLGGANNSRANQASPL